MTDTAYPISAPPEEWQPERRGPFRHIDPTTSKLVVRPAQRFTCAVVGCSFHSDYPQNLLSLQERAGDPDAILLWRERGNVHDDNAVAVVTDDGQILGHLPRAVAAKIAPVIDTGTPYLVTGWRVLVSWVRGERQPGLEVDLDRSHR